MCKYINMCVQGTKYLVFYVYFEIFILKWKPLLLQAFGSIAPLINWMLRKKKEKKIAIIIPDTATFMKPD